MKKQVRNSKVNSKPIPAPDAPELERLQYEHAVLYAAYQQRGKELQELQALVVHLQNTLGQVESVIKGALR